MKIYSGEKSGKYPDGNQVIVQGAQQRAVFDSPLVSNSIGSPFDEADLVIQGHIHEDHTAGLHRLPDIPVYVHEADLAALQSWQGLAAAYGYPDEALAQLRPYIEENFHFKPRPDAIAYRDGAQWDLGGGVSVRAIHAPGHTAGHCVLLVEPEGVAFIGDIDLSGFGPYYGDKSSSLTVFRRTLAQIADIPANTWVTSHHRGVYTQRDLFLQDLTEFTAKITLREEILLQRLQDRPSKLDELVAQGLLYAADSDVIWAKAAERYTIAQHLDELTDAGHIACDSQGRYHLVN